MRTYVTRPRLDWLDDKPFLPALSVYEAEAPPRETGLYDASGQKLYAVEDRQTIGFVRLKATA